LIWVVRTKRYFKSDGKTFILPHKQKYSLLPDLACTRNCWENTQTRMLHGSKYHKEHADGFDFICTNKKKIKCERKIFILSHKREYDLSSILNKTKAMLTKKSHKKTTVKISFCHTSEKTVYCLVLHEVEIVEKTRKPKCCMGQNITNNMARMAMKQNFSKNM